VKQTRVLIVGGGLAGLTAAIDLCLNGIEVILIEKEKFPHHKVCGEYLSLEVLPYLKCIGLDLESYNPPKIDQLEYSSNTGKLLTCNLDPGGIGISRYTMDNLLFKRATALGCICIQDTVTDIKFENDLFRIFTSEGDVFQSEFVLGAFGKRSRLDKTLNREFIRDPSGWLAVKSHYKHSDYPQNLVSLHNFKGGYCGLSKTDLDTVNVCYLVTYKSFKNEKDTKNFRENVLMKNPRLNEFFQEAIPVFDHELSIAQISFEKKSLVEDHIIMIGDAAGLIHPLCGNGMAMAIHSGQIAAHNILTYYKQKISRQHLEENYQVTWKRNFNSRMKAGRVLQKILMNNSLSEISQGILSNFPALMSHIIRSTHGKPLYV
jgi:menaquinone-9 beta-reductase